MDEEQKQKSIETVISVVEIAGSQKKLGENLGVVQQTVSAWLNQGIMVPAQSAIKMHLMYDADLHSLRPDLFPENSELIIRERNDENVG